MSTPQPSTAGHDHLGRIIPPKVFASAEDNRAFWRDGYVVTDLLDDDAVALLFERFATLEPSDGFDASERPSSDYHCTFLDDSLEYRRAVDAMTHELIDPVLEAVCPDFQVLTSNIYVKQPGHGNFEVHLNWITVDDPMAITLTIWIPFDRYTPETGVIHVVPGSHKLFPDAATAAATQYFAGFHQELIDHHLVPLDVRVGQAVIFDDTLIHWSPGNHGVEPRIALQVEIVPRGSTTAVWVPDPEDERWFVLYDMDRTFWLEQDKTVFYSQPDLPVLKRVPNHNRAVSYAEFVDRLEHGDRVRSRSYVLDDLDGAPER